MGGQQLAPHHAHTREVHADADLELCYCGHDCLSAYKHRTNFKYIFHDSDKKDNTVC
jgi:hypothetical protein